MPSVSLPKLAVLLPYAQGAIWIDVDGNITRLTHQDTQCQTAKQKREPVLCCHKNWCESRLEQKINGLDILELFAFQHPARFAVPTPLGLASVLGLNHENTHEAEAQAQLLPRIAETLLAQIAESTDKATTAKCARFMAQGGWGWGPMVLSALNIDVAPAPPQTSDVAIWTRLDEIPDFTPAPPSGHTAISPSQAQTRLNYMLGRATESRTGQQHYTNSLIPAFTPSGTENPQLVLAEAGTGTGKTIGYLAPATLWAETNTAPVWISTYTRSLQHQIASEMTRLYPDPETRDKRVVIRKGRENYLCLLNLEEALLTTAATPENTIALGLMARWAEASGDGDLTGARFPAWLTDLFGWRLTLGLADRRGECIHSACSHYRKCYVESSRARAQHSDIVIANHALVMIGAVMQSLAPNSEAPRISHYVFDEGHHLFEAADSAFSTAFTAAETADLRRWIRGNETRQSRDRTRGIRQRLSGILPEGSTAMQHLEEAMVAAEILPTSNWRQRLNQNTPQGILEEFFHTARQVIYARTDNPQSLYSLEVALTPLDPQLTPLIRPLREALITLARPLTTLAERLKTLLSDESANLDSESRRRIEGAARGLIRRASGPLAAWIALLESIESGGDTTSDPDFIDWLEATRQQGEDRDIGIHRHWIDPSRPFHDHVLSQAKGVVITSATLTDRQQPPEQSKIDQSTPDEKAWELATHLTGASHLNHNPHLASVASPFDYSQQARVFIINDCNHNDTAQVKGAMSQLMQASGGGALGLFTAITRLKNIYKTLAPELAQANLPLYAQHIDAMNLNTLIQIFRAEVNSCLLGTDALRDGIDVPGDALRLIIFDRTPWPRPNMLFKARSQKFGRETWTNRQTRMKLRQAFGRLIRHETDKGIFIMLDNRLPTKLTSAFPKGTPIIRCGLAEAIKETREFFL